MSALLPLTPGCFGVSSQTSWPDEPIFQMDAENQIESSLCAQSTLVHTIATTFLHDHVINALDLICGIGHCWRLPKFAVIQVYGTRAMQRYFALPATSGA